MLSKPITYISFFDTQDSIIKRNYVTSAANKIEYIANAIASSDINVEILSASQVIEERFKLYPSEQKHLSENISVKLPFSWGGNRGFLKKVKIVWHLIYLLTYLIFKCRKSDTVIVYHSLGYFDIIRWAKKICNFKLILEVEEIYSDVSKMSSYWKGLEFKMFDIADAFILSNDLLNAKINVHHKPSVVIYGTYHVEQKLTEKFNDGKIHAVYAGTFDPDKGGAQAAISAVEYLPENYHVHICGFGEERIIQQIKKQIDTMQAKSRATVTYDGLKKGTAFIEFLQKCHIGLSTQKPDGKYNDTSFPSKILTYMSNGLAVVSIRIPVLLKTMFSNQLSYYDMPAGQSLAEAIMNCDLNVSYRDTIIALDKLFKHNINSLIKHVQRQE